MSRISDAAMLRAARRDLKRHLSTRPASPAERAASAAAMRIEQASWQQSAEAWRIDGDSHNADQSKREAFVLGMRAASIERATDDTWEETRRELEGRVSHYAGDEA